jgi:hypothetical protein
MHPDRRIPPPVALATDFEPFPAERVVPFVGRYSSYQERALSELAARYAANENELADCPRLSPPAGSSHVDDAWERSSQRPSLKSRIVFLRRARGRVEGGLCGHTQQSSFRPCLEKADCLFTRPSDRAETFLVKSHHALSYGPTPVAAMPGGRMRGRRSQQADAGRRRPPSLELPSTTTQSVARLRRRMKQRTGGFTFHLPARSKDWNDDLMSLQLARRKAKRSLYNG